VPIERAYATSYLSLAVTSVVSRTVFEISTDKARKWLFSPPHPCLTPRGKPSEFMD